MTSIIISNHTRVYDYYHCTYIEVVTLLLSLQDVPSSSVRLLVLENLMLRPVIDVYVTPFTIIHYTLERRKHGCHEGDSSIMYSIILVCVCYHDYSGSYAI